MGLYFHRKSTLRLINIFSYFDFVKNDYRRFIFKGSKWITNKWIRQIPQLLNFPCSIEGRDRLKPYENDMCKMISSCKPTFGFGRFEKVIE